LRCLQQPVTGNTYPDHACQREAQLYRISDCYDLHDLRVDQVRHPLAHAGLRYTKVCGNLGKRTPPVLLQRLDDVLVDFVDSVFLIVLIHGVAIVPCSYYACNADSSVGLHPY